MLQFFGVAGRATEPPNEEPTTHATSAIDIFVFVGDFGDDPIGLSGTCPIPQRDHQQHRDETSADSQGDVHDGVA